VRDTELEQRLRDLDLCALEDYRAGKAGPPLIYKAGGFLKEDGPSVFVASEESADRLGDVIAVDGWDITEFKKNPVFLWSHDHSVPPIGNVPKIWKDGRQLLNSVSWDDEDEFARLIHGKYDRRVMRAESVGFRALDFKTNDGGGINFVKQELLEISAVAIPAHPHAIAKAMAGRRFAIIKPEFISEEVKRVIGWASAHPNGTPAAPRDADWDAGREVQAADVDDLKIMCAWVDSDNTENKGGYKLPHHRAGGEHPVVFRALAAVVAVLNGARGGADIPDSDREGCYRHIARHFRDDFEADPPPLREETEVEEKTGAVLSKANRGKLTEAMNLIKEVLVTAEKPGEPEEDEEEDKKADLAGQLRKFRQELGGN
jgi:hypothetical protein